MVYRIFAKASGLDRLIERYPCRVKPSEPERRWQIVQIGPVVFMRCVEVIIGPQGLYLHVKPVLSTYQPMLIPWTEFHSARSAFLHWRDARRLEIGRPAVTSLTVYGRLLDDLRPFLPSVLVDGL